MPQVVTKHIFQATDPNFVSKVYEVAALSLTERADSSPEHIGWRTAVRKAGEKFGWCIELESAVMTLIVNVIARSNFRKPIINEGDWNKKLLQAALCEYQL